MHRMNLGMNPGVYANGAFKTENIIQANEQSCYCRFDKCIESELLRKFLEITESVNPLSFPYHFVPYPSIILI